VSRIRRLLIANRGEIAARVIRTCSRLGIESVLAASESDLDSLPARLADRVVRLGNGEFAEADAVLLLVEPVEGGGAGG